MRKTELPLVISFSGGKSSGLMLRFIQTHYGLENTYVVFANTGKENPETLDFVNQISVVWEVPIIWAACVYAKAEGTKEADFYPEGSTETEHDTSAKNGYVFYFIIETGHYEPEFRAWEVYPITYIQYRGLSKVD